MFVVLREGVKKISGRKLLDSNREELEKALAETKDKMKGKLSSEVLEVLRKEFGEFEIGF